MAEKLAYPILITWEDDGYIVDIPDFHSSTQGDSIPEAMEMARDAIGILGVDLEDNGEKVPVPSKAPAGEAGQIVTLVDVDFAEYRKQIENKAVRKNVTIPYRLSVAADKEAINYSRVLAEALEKILGMKHYNV